MPPLPTYGTCHTGRVASPHLSLSHSLSLPLSFFRFGQLYRVCLFLMYLLLSLQSLECLTLIYIYQPSAYVYTSLLVFLSVSHQHFRQRMHFQLLVHVVVAYAVVVAASVVVATVVVVVAAVVVAKTVVASEKMSEKGLLRSFCFFSYHRLLALQTLICTALHTYLPTYLQQRTNDGKILFILFSVSLKLISIIAADV